MQGTKELPGNSANVLLDENWNAKLADFGLATVGLANQDISFVITHPAGTHGYCDPQYERTGRLTKESDVYSFGVVLFEVLCGRMECVPDYHDERRFFRYLARTCYENGELDKIIDHRIQKDAKPKTLLKISALAYQCMQITREKRPAISEVVFQLNVAMKVQLEVDYNREVTLSDDTTNLKCSHGSDRTAGNTIATTTCSHHSEYDRDVTLSDGSIIRTTNHPPRLPGHTYRHFGVKNLM
ncbi:hypothetical protein L2E82_29947 [Cichorium intybus]|uniref:Uncharacterized protein n=1 Tax=Cichorium intybus TaxID=13427 RepID=A0ACB9CYY5_CICIN|nr:hypothetical protein L2E82_29947 [Cichorium intybus]